MFKEAYNPKAFLALIRNIRPGLVARTKLVSFLEKRVVDAETLARETGLRYAAVLYHLRLLEAEGIIARKGKRPYSWELTGAGQQRLVSSAS